MARPSNHDIAAVFREMAELLAIRGGDRHRVRAFERVARIVENLPEERPLAAELRERVERVERVERFLRHDGDDVLEEALTSRDGNAVQRAFDLLMG